MSKLVTKKVHSEPGDIVYFYYHNPEDSGVNLYIHGLGYNRNWFPEHFENYGLNRYSWIVPDLMGHGDSTQPEKISAYTMENQAHYLLDILQKENVQKVRILAHSMGGPIAISLLEHIDMNSTISPSLLLYLEGNLDEGDAFFSSRVASMPLEQYQKQFAPWFEKALEEAKDESTKSWLRAMDQVGPFAIWASSKDLVAVSKTDRLLPRLFDAFDGPIYFVFGARNRGNYSSESLVKESGESVVYVPDAGHGMHEDNPEEFWSLVFRLIEKHS